MEKKPQYISSRFSGPSGAIDMEKLEKETQKLLFLGLLVAVAMNAAIGAYYYFQKTKVNVAKPLTMELIVRKTAHEESIRVQEKRVAKRIYQRREIQQRQPSAEIQVKQISNMDLGGTVATYEFDTNTEVNMETQISIPEIDIEMTATRTPDRQISMKEEMITLNDLDTGQFRAMIIQDPTNKQDIKGFVYIATAWGTQLRPPDELKRAVINLVEAVNRYTNINAKVDNHLFIDSRKIFETPFVYITADIAFELTDIERKNFGNYLRNGGFAVADNGDPKAEFGQAEASLRQMFRDALGPDAKFLPIENNHPLYHCFFDFDYGPPQGSENGLVQTTDDENPGAIMAKNRKYSKTVLYLEGIWLENRLVAIYSDKGYAHKWKDLGNNEPQLKMGVNMVVFALTQRGSIAQQKMDLFSNK